MKIEVRNHREVNGALIESGGGVNVYYVETPFNHQRVIRVASQTDPDTGYNVVWAAAPVPHWECQCTDYQFHAFAYLNPIIGWQCKHIKAVKRSIG